MNYKGLDDHGVLENRKKYGYNEIKIKKNNSLIFRIIKIFKEPMFILLLLASLIYFLLREYSDGIIMLFFVIVISLIEFIQEEKTNNAIIKLDNLASLNVKVIRNGKIKNISSKEVVVGDLIVLEEGNKIPADGKIIELNAYGVDESIITGESNTIYKKKEIYVMLVLM